MPSNTIRVRWILRATPILVAALLAIAWAAWPGARPVGAAAAPPRPAAAAVAIALASRGEVAPTTWVTGSVESRDDAQVASELPGRVLWVADVGARLARGAALARLDDAPLRLQVVQQEAGLAVLDAQLALAERQVSRLSSLERRSSVAETQLDQARSERDVLAASRAQAAAVLAEGRRRVEAAVVRAPFDGIVVERIVRSGEYVQAGAAVARFVDTVRMEVRATAPLGLAAALAPGAPLLVRADGREEPATLRALVPVGDRVSRQVELRVELARGAWMVGAAVDVRVPSGVAREAVLVPRDALVLRGRDAFVFRVGDDAIARRVPVRPGAARGGDVEIEVDADAGADAALVAGDRLVVRGAERLVDGQPVQVVAGA